MMKTTKNYDVIIIGAGTAGLTARKVVANKTNNYLVVDDGVLGTTCARVGCMPSKVLIQVANDFHRRKVFQEVGISGSQALGISLPLVMQHVRKLRDRFVKGVIGGISSWESTHLCRKRAKFISQTKLDLDGEIVEAKKIIIATGSHPVIPDAWSEFKEDIIDTNTFFELENLPRKIAVIGLGVIGIELGQALSRLGVDVIGIGRSPRIGGVSDPEMVNYVADAFSDEMNLDFTGVQSIEKVSGQLKITTKNDSYLVDKLFLSVGRAPNIKGLNLESIGIETNRGRILEFNQDTLQIAQTNIFVAGDVNGIRPILHESADEGSVAGHNVINDQIQAFKRRTPIGVTFCSPNIAVVGQSHKTLTDSEKSFVSGKVSFEGQGRSIVMLKEKGLLKLYACPDTKQLLGAEIFGPSGEHIAHLLAWIISLKVEVKDILTLPFYHPVIEEGLRTALRDLSVKLYQGEKLSEIVFL